VTLHKTCEYDIFYFLVMFLSNNKAEWPYNLRYLVQGVELEIDMQK
jgi:hypothetical protein